MIVSPYPARREHNLEIPAFDLSVSGQSLPKGGQ
jgi:hypothetical protein